MENLRQLLDRKGSEVFSIGPDETVYRAVEEMSERGVGALVVVDGDGIVGVLSERDYARKVILCDRASRETAVREIMTAEVIVADPGMSVEHAMAVMTEKRVRHLPVLDGGVIRGLVSIGDLVRSIIAEQRATIEHLEGYIMR